MLHVFQTGDQIEVKPIRGLTGAGERGRITGTDPNGIEVLVELADRGVIFLMESNDLIYRGPPFKVGDIVIFDIPGAQINGEKATIGQINHPTIHVLHHDGTFWSICYTVLAYPDSIYHDPFSKPIVCECGSKDPNPTGHSSWCPKHSSGGTKPFKQEEYIKWKRGDK